MAPWGSPDAGSFDGPGPTFVPVDHDPFAAAAARTRASVMPPGGRQEGAFTKVLDQYVPHVAKGLAALPQRAFGETLNLDAAGIFAL